MYVDSSYRGAAIVHDAYPAPYLSKFAVQPEAQGEGIGRDIWEVLVRHHAELYWRSRSDNPIASWYLSVCDGMVRRAAWQVYFRGLAVELIPEAVAQAEARGPDFSTHMEPPTPEMVGNPADNSQSSGRCPAMLCASRMSQPTPPEHAGAVVRTERGAVRLLTLLAAYLALGTAHCTFPDYHPARRRSR